MTQRAIPLLAAALVGLCILRPAPAQVLISEFMADNRDSLLDEDGDASDWIELYNAGAAAVDLDGWYLTDDPGSLTQWRFPPRTLEAGAYLLVFASGKDRRPPAGELHTSFRLGAGGEFFALVRPGGTTLEHGFAPAYPSQLPDVSYGIGQAVDVDTIVPGNAEGRILVPADDSLGTSWRGGAEPFDDGAWVRGPMGVGYVTSVPGFSVTNYLASVSISDLGAAEQVIDNEGLQAQVYSENAEVIDYLGTSAGGHYGGNRPFPGAAPGDDVDDFVIEARGIVTLPFGGPWTFGVLSDDGFSLDISGPGGTFHIEHYDPRGPADTLGVFNLATAGDHDLRLVMYERGGGSGVELFAAQGSHGSWNALDFRLVGNTAEGGLAVRSEVVSSGSLGSYLRYVGTDLEAELRGRGTTAYVRIPFVVADPDAWESLTLRVRYDDGFAAFLNGVEVARRNAPAALAFNARATTDRSPQIARIIEDIRVPDPAGVLRAGSNLLALCALNDRPDSSDLLLWAELADVRVESNRPGYFETPTPGEPNATSLLDYVRDTRFSVDRGFYEQPFDVEITTATAGAEIRYTIDGTSPTETEGLVYNGPIPIQRTTVLRAAAFKDGLLSTNVDTQTYLFLDDIIRQDYQATLDRGFPSSWGGTAPDYGMDPDVIGQTGPDRFGGKYAATIREDLRAIPTVSIAMSVDDMFGTRGIYTNSTSRGQAWERPCSVELILPEGTTAFQEDCGIRIQGGAFRSHGLTKKHSLRLLFKTIYGASKLRYPLFGEAMGVAQRFDTITFRSNSNDGWQWDSAGGRPLFVRDSFCRETLLDMGGVASHETFVHVYIDGVYWGLYNPVERPDASFSAEYFGGDKEEWDAISHGSVNSGSSDAWSTMIALSEQGLADDAAYEAIQGNFPDGTRNPALEDYVDVDNLIDCMIVNLYGGNADWPGHNYWTGRRRVDSTGFKFYIWDAEWTIGLNSGVTTDRTGVSTGMAVPYGAMRANAEFRQRFGDRVHRVFFHGGPLYVDPANPQWDPDHPERNLPAARFMRLAQIVDRAVVAESARWGDQHASTPYTRDEHWEVERDNLLENYFPRRSAVVLSQFQGAGLYPFIDAPTFSQHGGYVDPGFVLRVTAPFGVVYYTLDGTDPRLRGGAISSTAIEGGSASGSVLIRSGDPVRVLVPTDGTLGLAWTAAGFDDSSWTEGPTGVGYERGSGYEGLIGVDVGEAMYQQRATVYLRVPFHVADPANFAFLSLRMKYDDGFVAYVNGEQVAARNAPTAPAWDSGATQQNSDTAAVNFEAIDISGNVGALRSGPNVLAIHGLNIDTGSSDLIILPELLATGVTEGQGIVLVPGTTRVRARALEGGEWSALEEAVFATGGPPPLRITEIHYHPAPPPVGAAYSNPDDYEFIEIQNVGGSVVDLEGVALAGGIDFAFEGSGVTALAPGGFVVVVKSLAAFAARYETSAIAIAGEYFGRLANGGDTVILRGPLGETILEVEYADSWYPETDGLGYSLVISDPLLPVGAWSDPLSWRASGEVDGSPGEPDSGVGTRRGWQLPGDANQDGTIDISDPVSLLFGLFGGTSLSLACEGDSIQDGGQRTVLDSNGDAAVDLSDAIHILSYLFQGGSPPVLGTRCVLVEGCTSVCAP